MLVIDFSIMPNKPIDRDLQNYTTLKQHRAILTFYKSFRDLQNYTTLKHAAALIGLGRRFRDLQNYTTLKQ